MQNQPRGGLVPPCLSRALILWACALANLAGGQPDEGGSAVVLGTQRGVLPQEFRVFLASLRSSGCQARVVIFSGEAPGEGLLAVAETFGAEVLEYNFAELSAEHGPMNTHRFELFRRFLAQSDTGFSQVLLCDVRDVMFQEDPFATLSVAQGIGVAIEPVHLSIGACDVHTRWLTQECPSYIEEGILEQVAGKSRSCAGTTIGTHRGILTYTEAMLRESKRTARTVDSGAGKAFEGRVTTLGDGGWRAWCNDQGIHNVLLWTGRLGNEENVTLHYAESSGLATVGTMQRIDFQNGEVVVGCSEERGPEGECEGGMVASLVHQYDRVKALVDLAQSLYGAEGEVFQTFQERHGLA